VAVVEEAVEAADPVPGPEQPLLPAGVPAAEPGCGAEGDPAEERREGRLEEHGLGLGEAADGVDREHRLQEVEALVPRRAHGAHLPVAPPAARHRDAARGAVAAEVVVVPRIAGAEAGVVREHARRRAARHGCVCVIDPLSGRVVVVDTRPPAAEAATQRREKNPVASSFVSVQALIRQLISLLTTSTSLEHL
jgi:hypothetical protein